LAQPFLRYEIQNRRTCYEVSFSNCHKSIILQISVQSLERADLFYAISVSQKVGIMIE
jgi:hypothetical protein